MHTQDVSMRQTKRVHLSEHNEQLAKTIILQIIKINSACMHVQDIAIYSVYLILLPL